MTIMKNYKSSLTLARAAMTLLIALLTATTAWAQDAITGLTYNSTGGYYEINDAQDLVDLATYVNGGNNASGKTFKQTQDIDMSSIGNLEPIGSQPNSNNPPTFNGTYDGQGYAIIGLTVNTSSPYAGLFGYMVGGSVRNVTMVNPHVTSNDNSYGGKNAGGIVGVIKPGTIENCNVINPTLKTSSATGYNIKGAICGGISQLTGSDITDCYYYTTTNYDAVGSNVVGLAYSASRTYTLTLNDGITTSTAPAFSYGGTGYYAGTITLAAAPTGWVYEYSVNGSPIDGNTFDISGNATVSRTAAHISPLLGYDDDPLVDGSAEHPYIISTAEGWGVFCDCLNDNDTWNRFSGKTVKLGDNITVTRMAGSDKHDFCGTFDGDEHTITLDGNSANGCYTLFRNAVGATIRDLHVTGTITTAGKYAAGFISGMWGNVTIENCRSSVIIRSSVSGDGTHGGFVAVNNSGTLDITGCTFDGKLLTTGTTATSHCGGFVGWNAGTLTITNSLYAPADLADGETEVNDGTSNPSATFARNGATLTNSYYTRALGTAQGKALRTVAAADDVTIDAVALTGTATEYDVSGITAYSVGGLQCGETLYYGSGDEVSLTLSNSATGAPQGYQYGYTASAGTLDGTTLTMPDEDVTISVNTAALEPIDWATVSDGDWDDPYMIYNKDQLLLLAHRVNGTNDETANDYKSKYFKLGADITFSHAENETEEYDENYEAIGCRVGSTMRYFKGKFDGDGHTVSGIRIRKTGSGTADSYQGLFGRIGSGAEIYDVHLTDARITGDNCVGGIAGYNDNGNIRRCTVTDSYITANSNLYYGTICGIASKTDRLRNNYYYGCTVNSTENATNVGCYDYEITEITEINNNGALPAYAITLGDGVSTTALASAPENGFVYNGVSYYRKGLALPLASTLGSEVPEGYTLSFSANGTALSDNTYTVNTTDGDVTITAAIRSDGLQHEVSYVDADGTTHTAQAIALDGHEAVNSNGNVRLASGTYYVGTDIAYANRIWLGGAVTLILADGKTMTLNGNTRGIVGNYNLTIYGQSLDDATAGTLRYAGTDYGISANNYEQHSGNVSITTTGSWVIGINADVTLRGGTLTISANGYNACAISGEMHSILGGQLTATATGTTGIYGTAITLGWTRPDDRITASSISTNGCTVAVADGQALADESGHIYTSTLTAEQLAAIANQKLTPVNLYVINGNSDEAVSFTEQKENATVIYDRKFTADVASTIVLPFDFDAKALDGALHTISSIDVQNGKWVATASDAITQGKANTPYLFKPNSNIVSTTFKDVTIVSTEEKAITIGESNWQMKGVYQLKKWEADSPTDYGFAGAAQQTTEGDAISAGDFVRVGAGAKIRATRCYLTYDNGISKASPILPDRITVIFPDATASIIEPQPADPSEDADPSGDITTPISEIAAQSGTKVWGYDGTIYIESQPYTPYTMIDLAGRTLRNGVTNSTREEITLSRPAGIVIVRIGGKTFKIFNR